VTSRTRRRSRCRHHHAGELVVPDVSNLSPAPPQLLQNTCKTSSSPAPRPSPWASSPTRPGVTTATEISITNNSSVQTTLITPLSDLAIVRRLPDPVNPVAKTLTYTIAVTNAGPYTATNVIVTDTLQPGLVAALGCGLDVRPRRAT